MAKKQLFLGGKVQLLDDNGDPLAGGKVHFFEPGTSTRKDSFSDSALTTANANPVILDAAGRATIYLSGNYKVRVDNSADVTVYTQDNITPEDSVDRTAFNLLLNPSFEENTNGDGKTPDDWTLVEQGTALLDTADQQRGTKSIKFTSTGSGGGSVETAAFIEVSELRDYTVSWLMRSSVVDVRNVVQVKWYDNAKALLSTVTVYDEAAANPTTWTKKSFHETPPANARFCKFKLIGCDPSDATSGSTWFDDALFYARADYWKKGTDIASVAALPVDADGNIFDVTGTTTITSLNSKGVGTVIVLHFDAALTLTHHATNLILPGSANITTAAGDEAIFYEYAAGNWRCVSYQTAASAAGVIPSGTRMIFQQTAAPNGWTKDTTANLNDTALRIVTGTVGSETGQQAFSAVVGSSGLTATDGHTIVTGEIPAHGHAQRTQTSDTGGGVQAISSATLDVSAGDVVTDSSTENTGGGGAHSHNIDLRVNHHDVIVCSKN